MILLLIYQKRGLRVIFYFSDPCKIYYFVFLTFFWYYQVTNMIDYLQFDFEIIYFFGMFSKIFSVAGVLPLGSANENQKKIDFETLHLKNSKAVWNTQVFLDGDTCPRLTSLIALLSSYAISQIIWFSKVVFLNILNSGFIYLFLAWIILFRLKNIMIHNFNLLGLVIITKCDFITQCWNLVEKSINNLWMI